MHQPGYSLQLGNDYRREFDSYRGRNDESVVFFFIGNGSSTTPVRIKTEINPPSIKKEKEKDGDGVHLGRRGRRGQRGRCGFPRDGLRWREAKVRKTNETSEKTTLQTAKTQ